MYMSFIRIDAIRVAILLLFFVCAAASSAAQYGHPLSGSWSGDWGATRETRNRVLLELDWDGKSVTGTINPGPNAVPLQKASLDPSTWMFRFEAEG